MLRIMASFKQFKAFLVFPFVLVIAVWAYYPGLGGIFIFDDVSNISANIYLKIDRFSFENLWQASWSSYSGPLRRPVAMLSFGVNHIFTGMDPWWMKLVNLLIHLGNSLILLLLCKELFCRSKGKKEICMPAAPYVIAGIWLVHPVNVTAVSYIVQRMTSLSATFVLLAIYCYLRLRKGKLDNCRVTVLGLLMLLSWGLGLLTKEIALSLSVYIFAIEWCLYDFKTNSSAEKRRIGLLWMLIAAPWLCAFLYAIYNPAYVLSEYSYRDFTLLERVLTEFRIVIDYLRLIIVPDVRNMGLYHDNIVLSRSVFSPISTLLSIFLISGLLGSAVYARQKYPLFSLGILWFFGGHLLESTIYPLELMFLHRNYLPSVGIFLAMTEVVVYLYRSHRNLILVIIASIFIAYSLCTRSLAYQWSGDYRMLVLEAMNHPESIRANFRAGQVFKVYAIGTEQARQKEIYKDRAFEYFSKIQDLEQHDISGKMGMLETYLQLETEPPKLFIEGIVSELASAKVEIGLLNILYSIKKCMIAEGCVLKKEDYNSIVEALLNNPDMTGDFRRKLLVNHAEYLAKAMGNTDAAITTILEAIIVHPTEDDLMLLALYYEEGGYEKELKSTIDYLEERDKFGRFGKFIRETRSRIK